MLSSSRFLLIIVGAAAGLVVGVVAVGALLGAVTAKPRLEAIASSALKMDVKVGGRLHIGLLPGLHVALTDVRVSNRDAAIASVGEVDLGIKLLPLLHKEVRIDRIGPKHLQISIERDRNGKLNIDPSAQVPGPVPTLAISEMLVADGTLTYVNEGSETKLEAERCNGAFGPLPLSEGRADILKKSSLSGKLACGQFRSKDFTASDVSFSVDGKDGVLNVAPLTMRLFGGEGAGSIRADFAGSTPSYQIRFNLTQFRVEEFFKNLVPRKVGQGIMDFSATLALRGNTSEALVGSAAGEASLHGEHLTLDSGDIDQRFSRYQASQRFSLIDVAAFFFAGPVGLGVTKGFDYARIMQGTGGSTQVRTLVSKWQVERGIAHATDVAMATPRNRIALKGGLDFASGRFDEVTIALVDAKGCAQVLQKVRGSFLKPEVEDPNVLGTLARPTLRLLTQAERLLGRKCDVFYAGSVAAPPKS